MRMGVYLRTLCRQEGMSSADLQLCCESLQDAVRNVTWMTWFSDQYSVPALFLIPRFQQPLARLFPTRFVLTPLSRYLLHPANVVWERVVRVHKGYLGHVDKRVGVQVRTYGEAEAGVNQVGEWCLLLFSPSPLPPFPP